MLATSLCLSGSALSFPYVVHEISDDHEPFEEEEDDDDDLERDGSQRQGIGGNDVEILMMKCAAFAKSAEIPLLPNEMTGTVFSFQVTASSFD